ncbi:MAG: lysine--tRNA ligase [Opitutales bacterium]
MNEKASTTTGETGSRPGSGEGKPSVAEVSHDLRAVRMLRLEELRAAGRDPFAANWEQTHTSAQAKALYLEGVEDGPAVSVAGRILMFNDMGKSTFVKILDRDGQIQLYLKKDVVGEEAYAAFKKLDLGDIVGAAGTLFKTRTGEITVRVTKYALLAKALRPLPEKWHGLTDSEQIYRERHLDLIVNEESRRRFQTRSRIVRAVREFLWEREFVEVETPVLQNVAGGASARPFVTHFNALSYDFYMRIALELHLKRMLVGGFDRVFEIGRVFRNEGLSRRHNPEFTMLEVYQAYSDFRGMMKLLYDLIQYVCKEALDGRTAVPRPGGAEGEMIELGGTWREVTYTDLVIEATGDAEWFRRTKAEKLAACDKLGIEVNPALPDFAVTQDVFEKLVEPKLIQPTFVTHIPVELCPLAKRTRGNPAVLDVFEFCVNGQELAPAYSEQNDPLAQREELARQAGADAQKVDEEFLTALEHGMPPAGGMGVGIDRLVILLTGAANIRDTILFPSLKPAEAGAGEPPKA